VKPTAWGWRPERTEGIWLHGCRWAKPFVAAAPWITLALLLATFSLLQGRLSAAPGLVFDLPEPVMGDGADVPSLAAVVVPVAREGGAGRETLVFFDDERYSLSDDESMTRLRERLGERAAADASGTLLLLADSHVPSGHMMRLAGLARDAGVVHIQVAERRE